MYITTGALVLRETIYKESSKILTVLTPNEGRLTVMARGARRKGSKSAAGTQLLTYSEMTLYSGKGGWTLTEVRSIEQFQGLRDDLEKLALGAYFSELLELLSDEDVPNPEMMSLGLNSLFAVSEGLYPDELIKAAFEMRLMSISGYAPVTDFCGVCGLVGPEEPYLNMGGSVHCSSCRPEGNLPSYKLSGGAFEALKYIISADPKKVFSFKISDTGLMNLSKCCESYVQAQLDKRFHTLDYYKRVKT